MYTAQALAGVGLTARRSARAFKSLSFSLFSRTVFAVFCLSVRAFLFGFGLALAFFLGFGFGLILGFAFDLVLGTALAALVFGAGFLAALVADVDGALLAAVVVLPVWALGRDTGLSAYDLRRIELMKLGLKAALVLLLEERRA